jgi:electron transfer flavoprotein beta subunit
VNVAVCAKQVPEGSGERPVDPATLTLDRSGRLVLDDGDAVGVEVGLRLAEAAGGEVTVVSMAPRGEMSGLRQALAMGAARGVLVSDDLLAGSDALGTAKVLAAVARRVGADVMVAATESTDGAAGVVPVQVAALLGVPAVTCARRVTLSPDGTLLLERQTEAGWDDVVCPLPCVVTVTAGAAVPRYPSMKGIVGARSKPVEVLGVADLGLDAAVVGWAGARQEVVGLEAAAVRGAGETVVDDGTAHERVVALLERLRLL